MNELHKQPDFAQDRIFKLVSSWDKHIRALIDYKKN
jgi:hypothetical protein